MVLDSIKKTLQGLTGSGREAGEYKETIFQMRSASQNLVVIPETENITEIDVRYSLIEPFADAHVTWDDDMEELIYHIEEPSMNEQEEAMFQDIKNALEQKIEVPLEELDSTEKIVDYLGSKIDSVIRELGLNPTEEERTKIMYYIYRNFAGLNEIEPLMHDPYIEDIGCSGTGIPLYIVHSKFGSIKTNITFEDEDRLKNLVVKLAERCGKYVSYAQPLLDGSLPDGSRVNASLTQDVTTKGPTFSIRKFQETPYSAVEIIDLETANYELMAYFWLALEHQKSVLISGGTSTGKTTFLNSIVTFIHPEQKIVSIEDTRELQLPHQNWIPSVSRTGFGGRDSEEGEISMFQLLKESFRQNPDYVVVGEVRGEEASVLFQGMSSGHPSLGTIHASSPGDVVKRLTTPPISLSPSLVETLDIIVIMTRAQQYGKNARRVKGVYEVEAITPEGSPRTNQYFSWTPIDDTFSKKQSSTILDNIRQQFGMSQQELEDEIEQRKKVLTWMHEQGYSNFTEVARIVSEYYKDKESVMKAIKEEGGQSPQQFFEQNRRPANRERLPADQQQAQQELADRQDEPETATAESDSPPSAPGPETEEETPPQQHGNSTTAPPQDTDGQKDREEGQQEEENEEKGQHDPGPQEAHPGRDQDGEELFGDAEVEGNPFED
jgi:flagellar protein FlaI